MHSVESTYSRNLNFTQVQTANIFSSQFQAHALKRSVESFFVCLFICAARAVFGSAGVTGKPCVLG